MKKFLSCLFCSLLCLGHSVNAQTVDIAFNAQVATFIDAWHDDAAHANPRYFDKMAADGVYIGTDQSERWVRDDFKVWAKPYFARDKAWEFHSFNRHIASNEDKSLIWFDEQLHTQMGICQASGVIRNTRDGFKIVHYQLSLAVPNDLVDQFKKLIDDHDARPVKN
ncbi:hypothetical protein AAKU67_000234 [Oxalobacteraceae bacterium GrIS 2.11]